MTEKVSFGGREMTALGDHFREFAVLCDAHPEWTAAGIVATPARPHPQLFVLPRNNEVAATIRSSPQLHRQSHAAWE